MKRKSFPLWPDGYKPPTYLPNWRDESEYARIAGFTEYHFDEESQTGQRTTVSTSKTDYAWEFLRRNPWYQADYQKIIDLSEQEGVSDLYQKTLGFNIFLGKDSPPPSTLFHAELYRTLCRWGMGYYLLNPGDEIHDTIPLAGVQRIGNDIYPAVHVQSLQKADKDNKLEYIPIDGGVIAGDTETFWLFDISLPIEPQLKQAKTFLDGAQIRRYGKKKQASKTDPSKYIQYLRLLDAEAFGADSIEIMSVLFPGEDQFSYTDKNGRPYKKDTTHSNPGRDLLKNYRKAAYYLRDYGYQLIF